MTKRRRARFPFAAFAALPLLALAGGAASPRTDDRAGDGTAADPGKKPPPLTGRLKFHKSGEEDAATAAEIERLKRLAESGDAIAQYRLGLRLARGLGVPRDEVEACKWLELSGDVTQLQSLRAKLTPEEVSDAKRRAGAWLAAFGRASG